MTKIIVGGLYKKMSPWPGGSLNDQCYCLCLPIHNDDGTYTMLDTYQISSLSVDSIDGSRTKGAIELAFKIASEDYNGWVAKEARGNFYYKNQEKILNPNDFSGYELIADLHDWRPLKTAENEDDYEDCDVLRNVKLYFEHGYSWRYGSVGVSLIKKNAEKSITKECIRHISDAYSELRYPREPYKSTMDSINSLLEKGATLDDDNHKRLVKLLALNDELFDMRERIESL